MHTCFDGRFRGICPLSGLELYNLLPLTTVDHTAHKALIDRLQYPCTEFKKHMAFNETCHTILHNFMYDFASEMTHAPIMCVRSLFLSIKISANKTACGGNAIVQMF